MEKMKKRDRSKAYPGTTLEECVQNLIKIKKALGSKGSHDRNSLAKALGYDKESGPVNVKISALVQFGFLSKKGSGYSITQESTKITDPISEAEKTEAIVEAFYRPNLYSEILKKFSEEGVIPSQLPIHLHRFHGIAENASENAAKAFIGSGVYAGVLNEEGRILINKFLDDGEDEPASQEIFSINNPPLDKNTFKASYDPKKQTGERQYVFPLSRGMAYLKLPRELSRKDIEILRKHIEILELELEVTE